MPLIDTGSGATTSATTRTTAATDDVVAVAIGTPEDPDATGSISSASIVALLKSLQNNQTLSEILLELKRIRVGIGMLANTDLSRINQLG
jgi:hypothetical protein